MAVNLTLSETLDGTPIGDSINSGNSGIGFGNLVNGSYAPLLSAPSNTGAKDIYISHDGVNYIEDVSVHVAQFGVGTGYSYGGGATSFDDFASLIALGAASQASKNNADGLSGGLWMETRASVLVSEQFDRATFPTYVKTFGLSGQGISSVTAFSVPSVSMVYNAAGEQLASAPIAGRIGAAGDTVLGDSAHLRFRFYAPNVYLGTGIFQWDTVITFSFSS